jgi:acetyl esterase/lipase
VLIDLCGESPEFIVHGKRFVAKIESLENSLYTVAHMKPCQYDFLYRQPGFWLRVICLAAALPVVGCSGSIPKTPDDVVVTESVQYCTGMVHGQPQPLLLDVARPKDQSKDLPVILLVHGGGWVGGSRTDYRFMQNVLAQQQMVAVSIEYRLAPDSTFPAQIEDVKCAVRWVRENAHQYRMNTRRVVAMGASAGAHLVALLGTTQGMPQFEGSGGHPTQSSAIDAMVLHGGPYSLGPLAREMSEHPTADSGASLKAVNMLLGGNTDPSSKAYIDASPATYVSQKSVPTLLLHGQNDVVVPNSEAVRFATLLRSKGVSSDVLILDGASHGDFGSNPSPVVKELLSFIKGAY